MPGRERNRPRAPEARSGQDAQGETEKRQRLTTSVRILQDSNPALFLRERLPHCSAARRCTVKTQYGTAQSF